MFQITVKSSPLVPEKVQVCKQCHKNCLNSSSNGNISFKDCIEDQNDGFNDDWQPLILLGLHATNPAASLVKLDPFTVPPVPKISVLPATPENSIKNNRNRETDNCNECQKPNEVYLTLFNHFTSFFSNESKIIFKFSSLISIKMIKIFHQTIRLKLKNTRIIR